MYLHLGQDQLVNTADIIGVFDLDSTSLSAKTREFLAAAQKAGTVVDVSGELPKSFVLTTGPKAPTGTLYLSQLSAPTLKKRLEAGKNSFTM